MLTLALHRRYQRTCTGCGYSWVLTRREAQYRPRPRVARNMRITRNLPGSAMQGYYREAAMEGIEQDVSQQAEVAQQYARCARCGSTSYRQRPVTRGCPPDVPGAYSGPIE